MNPVMMPGPGGPPSGPTAPPPPPRPPGPGRTYSPVDRLIRPTAAAALVLGLALVVTPLVTRPTSIVPVATYVEFGDLLVPVLLLALPLLYIAVSLLTTRRIYSPVDSAPAGETAASSRPGFDFLRGWAGHGKAGRRKAWLGRE